MNKEASCNNSEKRSFFSGIRRKIKEEIKTINKEDPGSKRSESPKRRKYKRKKRGEDKAPVEKIRVKMIKVRMLISRPDIVFAFTLPVFLKISLVKKYPMIRTAMNWRL